MITGTRASITLSFSALPGRPSPGAGGHYYRIQNPAVLVEYDNTQNNGNHVHSVLRDLKNDFGEDVLQAHYQAAHALSRQAAKEQSRR